MSESVYIAVDIGAGSARVLAGRYHEGQLKLEELHRIANEPLFLPSGMHWNVAALYEGILSGLSIACQKFGDNVVSVGIDAFGNGYGYVNTAGRLLGLPYHYRDARATGQMERAQLAMDSQTTFKMTGVQSLAFNALYQVLTDISREPEVVEEAKHFLFLSDILNYWLSGRIFCERTMASCSQLYNVAGQTWADELFDAVGIPRRLFPELISPATVIGGLRDEISQHTGLRQIKLVAVGSHDTASAVAAIPFLGNDSAFLSSGTWSLLGIEVPEPILSEEAYKLGFTNELAVNGGVRLIKIIGGLWFLQACRRQWEIEGASLSFAEISSLIGEAPAFRSLINPNDSELLKPGNTPERIKAYCKQTNQPVPRNRGEVLRCVYESLALSYAEAWNGLKAVAQVQLSRLNVVGGGCQDAQLNRFTANAIGVPVRVGPVEATGLGNILSQMQVDSQIDSQEAGRRIVAQSFSTHEVVPDDAQDWSQARAKFNALLGA